MQVPLVRMHAAATLERLAEPGEDGSFKSDPVVAAYRRLMNCERNKDIRKCLLAIMPVAKGATIQVTLPHSESTYAAAMGFARPAPVTLLVCHISSHN